MDERMYELADKFKELRDRKAELKEQERMLEEQLKETEWELIQEMTNKELDNFRRKGVLFSVVRKSNQSVIDELKDEFYAEVHAHGNDDWFSINTNTLKGRIKELTDGGKLDVPEWISKYMKTTEIQSISLRK